MQLRTCRQAPVPLLEGRERALPLPVPPLPQGRVPISLHQQKLAKQVQPPASESEKLIPIKGPAECGLILQTIGLRIEARIKVYNLDRDQPAALLAAASPFAPRLFVEE